MISRNPLVVEVSRGPVVESSHQVMAAVADANGRIVSGWGNVQFLTVPRSAIKPLQVFPLIESGAYEKFGLTEKHLALACASHRGEKEHIEVAKDWLAKIGLKESDLVCGAHNPYNEAAYHELIKRGEKPSVLHNNCVGKHLALLTTALHFKEDVKGYEKPDHPAQVRLRKILTELMKIDHTKIPHGIDGCAVPTYPVPLQHIAMGYSIFLSSKETEIRKLAIRKIATAMKDHSVLFSGSDDFCYQIMKATNQRAFIKSGAEGVYAGFIPEKGVTFAVKCADGAARAAQLTVTALLRNYGGMSETEATDLKKFTAPMIYNHRGDLTGQLRFKKE